MAKKKKRRVEKSRDVSSQSMMTRSTPERSQPLALIIAIITIFLTVIIFMATELVHRVAIQGEQIEQLRIAQKEDNDMKERIMRLEIQFEHLQEKPRPPEASSETHPDCNVPQSERPDCIGIHRIEQPP